MKIILEHKLSSCPQITCLICRCSFTSNNLRALLYGDRGLMIGDVCPNCLKLTATTLKRALRTRANHMMAQPKGHGAATISSHQLALELLEVATEEVRFPSLYQRFLKHLERFAQDSQSLEEARFSLSYRDLAQRSHLEKIFAADITGEKE